MTSLLQVQALTRHYPARVVFRGVSFICASGEILGIVGPNGAGKTTMLRVIAGLLRADAGRVLVDGLELPRALSRVPIAYFAGEASVPPAARASTWQGLFAGEQDGRERRRIRLLSRGTRQALGLRTLLADPAPRLILLDEPWEGLDPDGSRWLSQTLRRKRQDDAAVLVSSHRLHDLAGVCDRCLFLDRGAATPIDLPAGGAQTGESLLAAFDLLREDRR